MGACDGQEAIDIITAEGGEAFDIVLMVCGLYSSGLLELVASFYACVAPARNDTFMFSQTD